MRTKLILVLALYFAVTSAAMADGLYVGAGFGVVKFKDEGELTVDSDTRNVKFSDTTLGWRAFAGYDLTEHFAIEAAYSRSGTAEDEFVVSGRADPVKAEIEFAAYSASLVGLYPVTESARLFGKAGYYSGEQKSRAFGLTLEEDVDGFTAGAGLRLDDDARGLSYRVDFDWYDTEVDELWTIGFGVQYSFGN